MDEGNRYEISVDVKTAYLADRSEPSRNEFVFAYTVTLTNAGSVPAQLISRHWVITDGENNVQEVRGLGVVGQQPLLQPGESFEYTSGDDARDRRRHDARHLPDGGRGRTLVRGAHPAIHPLRSARAPLITRPDDRRPQRPSRLRAWHRGGAERAWSTRR